MSVDGLRREMFRVSVGRRLKPASWPDGNRVAVALSFDVDNATPQLAKGEFAIDGLALREYGAIDGLPRVLRLLDTHNIAASFFVPAVSSQLHPQMIKDILARGRHEVGVHGWIHEPLGELNNEAEERRLLTLSIQYLTEQIGHKPTGFRAPYGQFSPFTLKLLREAGFQYDSSLSGSNDPYEIAANGDATGLVELPVEQILDDFQYLGPAANGPLPSADLVMQVFRSEFDVAYDEGGLWVAVMHPHVIGHRSRIAALDGLIKHMKSKPGVWFATLDEIARWAREHGGAKS